jgi:hypothetical protein
MSEVTLAGMAQRVLFFDAGIPVSGSQSSVVNMRGYTVKGVVLGQFSGTTLTFLAAVAEDGPYTEVRDDGGALVSVTVAASRYVVFQQAVVEKLSGVNFLIVASGSAEAAPRSLKVIGTVSTK